jgi:hypothetical protein
MSDIYALSMYRKGDQERCEYRKSCHEEREGQEEDAAAIEWRGKETVLGIAQLITEDADEPEKSDPDVGDNEPRLLT